MTRADRGLVSPLALRTRRGKATYWVVLTLVVTLFTVVFVFPLYWMATGALKTPEELAQIPPSFFPSKADFGVYAEAWDQSIYDEGDDPAVERLRFRRE